MLPYCEPNYTVYSGHNKLPHCDPVAAVQPEAGELWCSGNAQCTIAHWIITQCTTAHWIITQCTIAHWIITQCTTAHWIITQCTTAHWIIAQCTIAHWIITQCTLHVGGGVVLGGKCFIGLCCDTHCTVLSGHRCIVLLWLYALYSVYHCVVISVQHCSDSINRASISSAQGVRACPAPS